MLNSDTKIEATTTTKKKNSSQARNQNRQNEIVSEIGGVHFSNVTFGFTKLQLQLILTYQKPILVQ